MFLSVNIYDCHICGTACRVVVDTSSWAAVRTLNRIINISKVGFRCCFFQVSGQVTSERRCRWNQLKMLFPKGIECRNCPECPEGLGLVPQCGSRITTDEAVECTECQEGKSYSDSHDISSCKPCTICDPNEETISPCTRTKNAICGKCNAG